MEKGGGGEKKKARGDNRESCPIQSFITRCRAHVLVRHIPPGSDPVIHHDSQNQHGSKVGQALTFNEKMRCPTLPQHSFTSSKCTFFF